MRRLDETGLRVLFVADHGVLQAAPDRRRCAPVYFGQRLEAPVSGMANYHPKALPMEQRSQARRILKENAISALPLLDRAGRIQDVVFADGLDIETPGAHRRAGGDDGRRPWNPAVSVHKKILPKPLIRWESCPLRNISFIGLPTWAAAAFIWWSTTRKT